ncbi:MAG: UDP-3-O-[3-hydroxymyristoyl] N-acetylglucosamine deacetylase, partial [Haemophilus parainfluenzae]
KDKWVSLTLYNGFKLQLTIDFNHPVFNRSSQEFIIDFKNASYIDEIARARTFGFMQEMELMRVHNLGLGGNLSNAIVIDDNSILNPEGLRYEDEFVRHKALDAIGDLYVLGHPLVASFKGFKSGHAINNALLRALKEGVHYEKVRYLQDKGLPDSFHYV